MSHFIFYYSFYFQSDDKIDSVVLLGSTLCGFYAFTVVFFASEIGQRFSDNFNKIEDAMGQLNWYLFPSNLQRMLLIVVINAQVPVDIKFFGSNTCSREQFKKVKNFQFLLYAIQWINLLNRLKISDIFGCHNQFQLN